MTNSADFLHEAWLAGGNKSEDWPLFARVYQAWLARCKMELGELETGATRNLAVHQTWHRSANLLLWLRRHALLKYDPQASDLQSLVRTGKFNCLSGTVLYLALANDLDIPAVGLCREGHCRVAIIGPFWGDNDPDAAPSTAEIACLPIEPTAPENVFLRLDSALSILPELPKVQTLFSPANLGLDGVSLLQHSSSVHVQNASKRTMEFADRVDWPFAPHPAERQVTRRAILGLMLYNRGGDAYQRGDYCYAAKLLLGACQADPRHDAARANLWAALNATAIQLASHGEVRRGKAILGEILAVEPEQAETRHNLLYLEQF
ncbi:MAG: hypothetical protein SFX18_06780 [Pirellulales bacterium]|nr:hypothetical protein [Pirellulales bacterium]